MELLLRIINDLYLVPFCKNSMGITLLLTLSFGALYLVLILFARGIEYYIAWLNRDRVGYYYWIVDFIAETLFKDYFNDRESAVCVLWLIFACIPILSVLTFRLPYIFVTIGIFIGISFLARFAFDLKKTISNHIKNKSMHPCNCSSSQCSCRR